MSGTGTIGVETGGLEATGGQVGALAGELTSAEAGLSAVQEAGAAAQQQGLAGGVDAFVTQWGRALAALQTSTSGLGTNLVASGASYEMSDRLHPGGSK